MIKQIIIIKTLTYYISINILLKNQILIFFINFVNTYRKISSE